MDKSLVGYMKDGARQDIHSSNGTNTCDAEEVCRERILPAQTSVLPRRPKQMMLFTAFGLISEVFFSNPKLFSVPLLYVLYLAHSANFVANQIIMALF
jgi:hypothetical protein